MTRAKDREDSDEERKGGKQRSGFDDLWGELVEAASSTEASDAPKEGETKARTEEVRGEGAKPAPDKTEAGAPSQPVVTDRTQIWTEDARAFRKSPSSATPKKAAVEPAASSELGESPSTPAEVPSAASSASGSIFSILGPAPSSDEGDADAKMDALMQPPRAEPEDKTAAAEEPVASAAEPEEEEQVAEAEVVAEAAEKTVAEAFALRDSPIDDDAQAEASGGRMGLWIAAAVAVVGIGYFVATSGGSEGTKQPESGPVAVVSGKAGGSNEPPPAAHTPARAPDLGATPAKDPDPDKPPLVVPSDKGPVGTEKAAEGDADDVGATPAADRDPREPPAGTPDEIAAVFRKLPVSPADKPPVGGVGASGIHIDEISMGSSVDRSRCKGGTSSYSIGRGDSVNVCMRVVHLRQKEELVVLWQRDGGTRRRGKVVVKPAHAYRTRAYLKLRNEDAGRWTVRIQAGDVELASHEFTVVD